MEKELSNAWIDTTLGEVAKWSSGGTPSRSNPKYYGGNIPWIKTGDLNDGLITEASEFITEEGLKNSSAKLFPKGSVAIAMYGATIGKTGIFEIEAATNQACGVGIPVKCSSKFLFYFLKSQKQNFIDLGKGGAQPNISQGVIKDYKINLPTSSDQQQIVKKLDQIFSNLETAKKGLEKIPVLLKQFRQAVLSQAISGNLTKEWREGKELGNAIVFLKQLSKERENQYLNLISESKTNKLKKPNKDFEFEYSPHHSIKNWAIAKLENLVYMSARIGWKGLKADEYTQSGPLFLSVHGLNYGEEVNFDVAYHITDERFLESPEIMLQENDILLCKDGAGIGKLGIVKNLKEKATVNSSLLVIRAREAFHYKYLYYFLAGPSLQNIAKERVTGSAIPHLFQRDIKEFNLEMPPLDEQTEIVRRVDALFAKADAIEAKYKMLKEKIDNLPQAVLAKAFRGELTK
jgi:type I restriction enzyme, S subunit